MANNSMLNSITINIIAFIGSMLTTQFELKISGLRNVLFPKGCVVNKNSWMLIFIVVHSSRSGRVMSYIEFC